ncbi:hypothetical protein QYM36_013302, partial [Artemia franciscana]
MIAARDARENAYCPYSKFKVGAALRTIDGEIITGCNVENCSYGLAICAERTALVKAVSQNKRHFVAAAVCAEMGDTFVGPCGACRQFFVEFCENMPIFLCRPDLTYKETNSDALLPDMSYYDVLGIRRDSTDQEIRRAFKKLALMLHPDKNKNDPEAQDKFLKMKQAYEVLKDTDLRRKYDLYGEEGLDKRPSNNNYHSWSYYEKSFGLYDDDEEVVVLTSADFFQSVTSSDDYWFVNFYSPGCSHCHTIAPIWREFAVRMDGVIRVGAVNCQEYWDICTNNGIRSYPSLIFYPSGQQYSGDRTVEDLEDFILSALPRLVIQVNSKEQFSEDEDETMYLLFFCQDRDDEDCPSDRTKYKMAILL